MRLSIRVPIGREYQLYPVLEAIPHGDISEASSCEFHLTDDQLDIFACDLDVDGDRLDRVAVAPGHVRWNWRVGFHAGVVQLRILGMRHRPFELELVTDPSRAKLTRVQFHRMLQDIMEDSLSLIGLSGARFGVARGEDIPPQIARFEYLRQCIADVSTAVRAINARPLHQLRRKIEVRPLSMSRQVNGLEMTKALRTARKLTDQEMNSLSPRGKALANQLHGCLPLSIPVGRSETNSLRREHADILAALLLWQRFVAGVKKSLDKLSGGTVEQATAETVRRRCSEIAETLSRLIRLDLFAGVEPTRGPLVPSQVFRRARHYREFFRAYQQFFAGLGKIAGEFLDIPLRRTFDLYEMWCFLRLVRAASELPGAKQPHREAFDEVEDRSGLVLNLKAKPFICGSLRLLFKPHYAEVWKLQGPTVGSFSRPMEPDIAFEGVAVTNNEPAPAIICDAKYRVDEQINDAIASIHTYRDALVHRKEDGSSQRTVKAAFVIVPNIPFDTGGDWRGLDCPGVFFRQEYRDSFRFGAVVLRPGVTLDECRKMLSSILRYSEIG